uniref:Glucosylceramidase n=1 Tax=Panagrolaimus sp. JU765 TaxID=591449 RepID=A0AC34Q147_9BILA
MNATMQRDFIGQLLGPALKSRNATKDVKIMICDDQRGDVAPFSRAILTDPVAGRYVQGIAFHWYADARAPASVLSSVHRQFPSFFMLMTEACTGWNDPEHGVRLGRFSRASQYAHSIIEDLQNFAVGWTDWNLCLDEEGGPNWVKNFVDSPIIVNKTSRVFYKQPMFYALGHFSKFVPRGSHRVRLVTEKGADPTEPIEAVGFVNPQNQRIVVLHNPSNEDLNVAIEDTSHLSQPL